MKLNRLTSPEYTSKLIFVYPFMNHKHEINKYNAKIQKYYLIRLLSHSMFYELLSDL